MTKPPKPEAGEPAGDLHEIELDGINRSIDMDLDADVYAVDFVTDGPEGTTAATVEVVEGEATTTEIVPLAMSRLHTLFATLARQTEAWVKGKP